MPFEKCNYNKYHNKYKSICRYARTLGYKYPEVSALKVSENRINFEIDSEWLQNEISKHNHKQRGGRKRDVNGDLSLSCKLPFAPCWRRELWLSPTLATDTDSKTETRTLQTLWVEPAEASPRRALRSTNRANRIHPDNKGNQESWRLQRKQRT